jgi:hypothetical protein
MVDDGSIMTVFLVLLFPLLLMVFALLMGRVEERLHPATVTEDEVGEFLDQARPEEVNTLISEGWTGALARFRLRRRPRERKVRRA